MASVRVLPALGREMGFPFPLTASIIASHKLLVGPGEQSFLASPQDSVVAFGRVSAESTADPMPTSTSRAQLHKTIRKCRIGPLCKLTIVDNALHFSRY